MAGLKCPWPPTAAAAITASPRTPLSRLGQTQPEPPLGQATPRSLASRDLENGRENGAPGDPAATPPATLGWHRAVLLPTVNLLLLSRLWGLVMGVWGESGPRGTLEAVGGCAKDRAWASLFPPLSSPYSSGVGTPFPSQLLSPPCPWVPSSMPHRPQSPVCPTSCSLLKAAPKQVLSLGCL